MKWFKKGKSDDTALQDTAVLIDTENTDVQKDEIEKDQKPTMSFFEKLKAGLKKTQSAVFGRLDDVFSAFRSVDEELFEELEEVLISADIGVDTSVYMIDMLRKAARLWMNWTPLITKHTRPTASNWSTWPTIR